MAHPEVPASGAPVGERGSGPTDANGTVRIDPTRSMLRLAVGSSIEAVVTLRRWLEEAEAAQPGSSADDGPVAGEPAGLRALHVSIALLFASLGAVRHGLSRAADASGTVARFWSRAFSPARRMLGSWVGGHEAGLERWVQAGRAEVGRSRALARSVAGRAMSRVVGQLAGHDAVDALVQAAAGAYLRYLQEHPEAADGLVQELAGNYLSHLQEHPEQVQTLIRLHGDRYIEYLNRNPEMVQNLVSGQSTGLATELVDGVRARTVSADNVFEAIARSILHRTPRERLPGPSPAVQRRAERATLPSDLRPPGVDEDAGG
jgi:hypothetical protein